jgi:hypothetical protein
MSIEPVDLSGGKSVYCFNEAQLERAFALAREESESGEKIRAKVEELNESLTRNERAALAFVIIDVLNKTSPDDK